MKSEYTIVSDRDKDDFIQQVNNHIKLGWKPIGGVVYEPREGLNPPSFHQTLIKG